jgi:hypothetical protein
VNVRDFGQPLDSNGRTIWIVDAHRDDGTRFIVRADEKLTAFVELESPFARGQANKSRVFHHAGLHRMQKNLPTTDYSDVTEGWRPRCLWRREERCRGWIYSQQPKFP